MRLINSIKINHMPKMLFWLFLYTIATFLIGILCKVLVAWHVNDMHSELAKTHELFAIASAMPGGSTSFTLQNGHVLTLGDIIALDFMSKHANDVSSGDGTLDRFYIYSRHIMGHEQELESLRQMMSTLNGANGIDIANINNLIAQTINAGGLEHLLEPVAGFQASVMRDATYAAQMTDEASRVFWLQIALIVLTLAAYPYGIYRMWLIKRKPEYKYDAKMYTRLIIEYVMFLIFFIGIDTYATYLLIAENVPMTFWNAFSVGSMAIPTGFAFGSLILIRLTKRNVVNPEALHFGRRPLHPKGTQHE